MNVSHLTSARLSTVGGLTARHVGSTIVLDGTGDGGVRIYGRGRLLSVYLYRDTRTVDIELGTGSRKLPSVSYTVPLDCPCHVDSGDVTF